MTTSTPTSADATRPRASLSDYVALARPSHWAKHVFILPGIALAALLLDRPLGPLWPRLLAGLVGACLIASANYVLNEWLDAAADALHPSKSRRPAVAKRLSGRAVALEYLLLAAAGLWIGAWVSVLFLGVLLAFLVSGWVYNIPPLRTKEVAYLDVLTESINNPIRLTLGWAMVDERTLPPASLLIAFWMGGAFLMAVKRLAEYRALVAVVPAVDLAGYRRSFGRYTESTLLVSSLVYALFAGFFVAVFFVKYRIEYLLALPALAMLFGAYLSAGLREGSRVQAPEGLFREVRLVVLAGVLVLLLALLTVVDIPGLHRLVEPHYLRLPFA